MFDRREDRDLGSPPLDRGGRGGPIPKSGWMIVKMAESLDGSRYKKRSLEVTARRMIEGFLFETPNGWVQGYQGQWLVELGDRLRCNLDHEAFLRTYTAVDTEVENE